MRQQIINLLNDEAILGIVTASVTVTKSGQEILSLLDAESHNIKEKFSHENFISLKPISDSRAVYTACGKNPNRYPVSSEALYRRILQGKGLYFVNNIVDINNLISIRSGYSVGSYSLSNISGLVSFRKGIKGEKYKAIGKPALELENLPLLSDSLGPFGSPTSDSEKTMIGSHTTEVMTVIFGFRATDLAEPVKLTADLFRNYCNAFNIETTTI